MTRVQQEEDTAPPATPVAVMPTGGAAAAAAQGLLQWQVQEGLLTPSQPRVLRYDASIGQHGAFYFADVGSELDAAAAATTAATTAQAGEHRRLAKGLSLFTGCCSGCW